MSIIKEICKAIPLVIVGVGIPMLTAAMGVPPDVASANLDKWAQKFGVSDVPKWFTASVIDHSIVYYGVTFVIIYSVLTWMIIPYIRKRRATAFQIIFDPTKISYQELLNIFWQNIDPTTEDKQFVDEGSQYRTGIFYHSDEQRRQAEESKEKLEEEDRFGAPIVSEITPAPEFYPAENYHQGYCR